MSSYNYEHFVRDFSNRTIVNIDHYSGKYEVTQLINSMLGLIIIPFELYSFRGRLNDAEAILSQTSYYKTIQTTIFNLIGQGRLKFDKYFADRNNMPKVMPLLNHLRNCLAHPGNGIRFFPVAEGADDVITDVYFIDDTPKKSFVLKIKIGDLQELVYDIGKMYSEAEHHLRENTVDRKYKERMEWADQYLQRYIKK